MVVAEYYIHFHVWLGLLFLGVFFNVCLYFWWREERRWHPRP